MDEGTGKIQCPICNEKFYSNKIEKHVDSCLLISQEEKPATRKNVNKSPKSFFQRQLFKRKLSPMTEKLEKKKKGNEDIENNGEIASKENVEERISQSQDSKKETVNSIKNNPIVVLEGSNSPLHGFLGNAKSNINNLAINTLPRNDFQEKLLKWSEETKLKTDGKKYSCNSLNIERKLNELKSNLSDYCTSSQKTSTGTEKVLQSKNKLNQKKQVTLGKTPLADQMRPTTFDDYFGQEAVNSNKVLKELFYSQRIPSLILWGPPGCGKTSLAYIISQSCKSSSKYRFVKMSATMSGVSDVKETVKVAKNEKKLTHRQTVLFMDEVHRFNKIQQDSFLPHVEDGTIVLIGATTENPSFHLNNALLSRCKLVVLSPLKVDNIMKILNKAVSCLGGTVGKDVESNSCNGEEHHRFLLENGVLRLIAEYAGGDARVALNSLDIVLQAKVTHDVNKETPVSITVEEIKEELKRGYINYDRNGDHHYDIISALHKSIRGGDANASVYWLSRMLEGGETPLYVARRLVRIASEDIGLADPTALTQAISAYQACTFIGMPECDVVLAQVVTHLARAPKSIEVYEAYNNAKNTVRNWPGKQPSVPLHLRNAPTHTMKELGYGVGYKYTPKCQDDPSQDYLPKELQQTNFFDT